MYVVYALVSEVDGSLYIGQTSDLQRRLKEHDAGKTRSTRSRFPYTLFYQEECESRLEAVQRERKLKSGWGREFLRQRLREFRTGQRSRGV